jgi:FkbM family methyltransferase
MMGRPPLKHALISLGLYRPARFLHDRLINRERVAEAREIRAAFSRLVKPGDLCFDVGANIGQKAEPLLSLGARVLAVEPQPACAAELAARCGGYRDFHPVAKAVGRAPGRATMFISDTAVFSSMNRGWTSFKQGDRVREIEVEVVTFDQLIDTYGCPDFCKIDVEGYELEVLGGLSRPVKLLSFEFHNRDHPEWLPAAYQCLERLRDLGAVRANVSLGEDMTLLLDEFLPYDEFLAYFEKLTRDPDTVYGDIYVRTGPA